MLKFYINDKQSHRGNRLFCWNKWIQGRIVKCLLFLSFLNTGLSDLSTALFSKTVRMSFFVKGNIQCQTAKHKFLLLKQKNCLKLNVSLTLSRAPWGSWAWRPFCSPLLVGKTLVSQDLLWVPKSRRNSKGNHLRQRLKGTERLIQIRRLTCWDPVHTLILLATPPPTLLKLTRSKYKTVTALILITYCCPTV